MQSHWTDFVFVWTCILLRENWLLFFRTPCIFNFICHTDGRFTLTSVRVALYKLALKSCVSFVVDELIEHLHCKYDLVESLPLILILTQFTPTCRTSFHTRITDLVFTRMMSVYCISRMKSTTPTPSCQSVSRHQTSVLISSKFVLTLASEEHLPTVCLFAVLFFFQFQCCAWR